MITIDSFKLTDANQIRQVCRLTCWKHFQKTEKLKKCMELMYVDYYIHYEPQNIIVARDSENGVAVGYILFSTDSELYYEKNKNIICPLIWRKKHYLAIFHYACIKQSLKYDQIYGGGFHINIHPDFQKNGAGKMLMEAAKNRLNELGVKWMYLITASKGTTGYSFYSHIGFNVVNRFINGTLVLAKHTGT